MRNLRQVAHRVTTSRALAYACYRNGDLVVLELESNLATVRIVHDDEDDDKSRTIFATFDIPELEPGLQDNIIDLRYNEVDDNLCLIMLGGDIILIHLSPADNIDIVEVVGTIDERILAARWSPDNEVLAVATKATLSILTNDFETLSKIDIDEDDIRLSANQVSVGWGRSETQFRGKRAARDPTLPEVVELGTLSDRDHNAVTISWRGDANYVSMSNISKNRRVIWVYSRDGVLESTSEPVDQQLEHLSWKADGSLITAVQWRDAGNHVIFFEKNGLKHGGFDLLSTSPILDLQWNCDSTILAVLYPTGVDLWTSGNYHYYLKCRIPVTAPIGLAWHGEDPLRLLAWAEHCVVDMNFTWICHTHKICIPHDFGLVAVIDGKNLNLTPMRKANIPPPMSYRTLTLPGVPMDVAISNKADEIFILLSSSILVYQWDLARTPVQSPVLVATLDLQLDAGDLPLQIVHSSNGHHFVSCASSQVLRIKGTTLEPVESTRGMRISFMSAQDEDLLVQARSGFLQRISDSKIVQSDTKYSSPLVYLEIYKSRNKCEQIVALDTSGTLYLNGQQIRTKVTSCLQIGRYLSFTRATDLSLLHLEDAVPAADEIEDGNNLRTIERGSLLVCACPSAQSIILQAPRGNLETIFPRSLVLSSIADLIEKGDWQSAWKLSKVHRIDPNFLHDFSPKLFLNDLKPFVSGLKSSSELDIFLTGLKSEDVCKTMYPQSSRARREASTTDETPHKVNTICQALLTLLHQDYAASHMSSILTSHLCKIPADYAGALTMVANLSTLPKDDAITHLCFLADPHLLYQESLGLYNLPMALLFAQKSQKDPREYIPFLQHIQTFTDARRRFTLDDHLGFHAKAVKSLLEIEDCWEECTKYIARHELWSTALESLKYDSFRHKKLLAKYAAYLLSIQDFADAGFAFESVGDWSNASAAFERAGYWVEALHNAIAAGLPEKDVAERLKDQLVDQSRFLEAAEVSRHHLGEVDAAISLYCRSYDFNTAIYLASTAQRIGELVRPHAIESFSQISELLSEMRLQIEKQVPRLQELRTKRALDPEGYLDGVIEEDVPDNISLADTQASTNASLFTRYTGATAMTTQSKKSGKARRRQERQRAKGKKGTIWEEEYLVSSIRRLIERLNADLKDARRLIVALVRCELRENAAELQNSLLSLVEDLRKCMDEVFIATDSLPEQLRRLTLDRPELSFIEPFKLC